MDLITLAMAKKYTDEKAGYVEKPVFTYDGNGEVVDINGLTFHRITDKFHDLNTLVKMEGFAYGSKMEFTADDITITGETDTSVAVQEGTVKYAGNDMVFILALKVLEGLEGVVALNTGVYVFSTDDAYVSYLEFAETIHPIDPKFIPGAVLPVVEVKSFYATPTEEENKALTAFIGLPIIVKGAVADGVSIAAVMMYGLQSGSHVFSALMGADIFIGFQSSDGITWEPYGQ